MDPGQNAERIASRIRNREQGSNLGKLLLEILVEELRIYRFHKEQEARERMANQSNAQHSRDGSQQRWATLPSDPGHKRSGEGEAYSADQHHRYRQQGQSAYHPPEGDARYMMTGGAGPREKHAVTDSSRGRRGQRSPPIGPSPTYKPKLGLTVGFGSYVRECIDHETERLDKEARRKDRRARGTLSERKAAKKAKSKNETARGSTVAPPQPEHMSGQEPPLGYRNYPCSHDHEFLNGPGQRSSHFRPSASEAVNSTPASENDSEHHDHSPNHSHNQNPRSEPAAEHDPRSGALVPEDNDGVHYGQSSHSHNVEESEQEQAGPVHDHQSHSQSLRSFANKPTGEPSWRYGPDWSFENKSMRDGSRS